MSDEIFKELSMDELALLVKAMTTLADDLETLSVLLEKAALESPDPDMLQAARIVADTIMKIKGQLANR